LKNLTAVVLATSLAAALAAPAHAQDVTEPRTGVKFAQSQDGMTLLGTALRTATFLKVKVYAAGLYVADSALSGALAKYKGKTASPEFYNDLVWGDFDKEIRMQFVRGVDAGKIQGAYRDDLASQDKAKVEAFVKYFGDVKEGDQFVFHWKPGGILAVTVAGQPKPEIADKNFAAAIFGIWLGGHPIQEDMKKDLVSGADAKIK